MSIQLFEDLTPQPFIETSLVDVTTLLPSAPPCRIFFKNEYEQPSASFKLRGISNLIRKEIIRIRKSQKNANICVFASSGGNAGLAAAYLARYYGVRCTVFLPIQSKKHIVKKLQEYGAHTVLRGHDIGEADKELRTYMKTFDTSIAPIYCHPFDNRLIWEGHSSMIDEIMQQLNASQVKKVKGVVCSVGGGGLYNGLVEGFIKNKKEDVGFLLVETKQAPTLTESIRAGKQIHLKLVNSIATSLACSYMSEQSLMNLHNPKFPAHVDLIDDSDSIQGLLDFYDATGKVVEPACGAALSTVFHRSHVLKKAFPSLQKDDVIVVIVCGGLCTEVNDLQNLKSYVNLKPKL